MTQKHTPTPDFGDYVLIEQKRHGVPNEMYLHKVVGNLRSNGWVDVPVQSPAKETHHDQLENVVRAICCGVSERDVFTYRVSDVKIHKLSHCNSHAALVEALESRPKFCEYQHDEGHGFDFDQYEKDITAWGFKVRAALALAKGE